MVTYIITDPMYIVSRDTWMASYEGLYLNKKEDFDIFCKRLNDSIEKLSGHKAWCSDTGIGDWSNRIMGDTVLEGHSMFGADGGMVCVCRYTDEVKKALAENDIQEWSYGLFEMNENMEVTIDKSDDSWYVLYMGDGEHKAHTLK